MITKQQARDQIQNYRKLLLEDDLKIMNQKICRKVVENSNFKEADIIFSYKSIKNEPCIDEIVKQALYLGKKVAFPKIHGPILYFYTVESFDDLQKGYMNIMEPEANIKKLIVPTEKSVFLVPGVAFDRNGNRTGYGKGYYDKYLHPFCKSYKIGIAFQFQIFSELQIDKYDIPMNLIITESEFISPK